MPEIKPRKTLFNPELRRRGIYLLPNLLTSAALCCGFFAIVQAMKGSFEQPAAQCVLRFSSSPLPWSLHC